MKSLCRPAGVRRIAGSACRFSTTTSDDLEPRHEKLIRRVPPKFWDNLDNRRAFFERVAPLLGVRELSDWYNVRRLSLQKIGGAGLLALHYNDSMCLALQSIYPNHQWIEWKFEKVPRGYWSQPENRRAFFDWAGQQLGVSKLDDWYTVNRSRVEELGGRGLLVNKYNHSLPAALRDVYPDHRWDPSKFSFAPAASNTTTPEATIVNDSGATPKSASLREVLEQCRVELRIEKLDDWYRVSLRQLKEKKLLWPIQRLVGSGGLPEALLRIYPEHKWQLSKFSLLGKKTIQKQLLQVVKSLFPPTFEILEDVKSSSIEAWRWRSSQGRVYQLDVFIPALQLALEYQGEQHYTTIMQQYKDTQHWNQSDAEKAALCQRNGVTLIEIPYWWDGNASWVRNAILERRPDLTILISSAEMDLSTPT